jgi:hypothetical protein
MPGGWGRGGYVMMPGPGQHATVNGAASQQRGLDGRARQRLSVRRETSKQFRAWYARWQRQWEQYWKHHRRHRKGHGATPSPTAPPTATATPVPTATASTPTATAPATPTTTPGGPPTTAPTATASPSPTPTGTGTITVTSVNWSGYTATGAAGTFTSVASGWTVPTVTCTGTDTFASFWVGLDGDGSNTVEQTGTEADCRGATPAYSGWFEMFPNAPVFYDKPVKPGDIMEASVTAEGAGIFMLTLFDMTQNWSEITERASATATLASAEVITEAPSANGQVEPLSNFGTVSFVGAAVNNVAIGTTPIDAVTMQSAAGAIEATPSAISGGIGNFSVTWDSNGS